MTKEEAIKFLKQLYPNGGHCWLDEQRIEAIGMAVKALQEEPVSGELEQEIDKYVNIPDNQGLPDLRRELSDCARHFANWQKQKNQETIELAEDHAMLAGKEKMKEQMMAKAVDGIARPYDNEIWCILDSFNLKAGDKVKVIVIKED